MSEHAYGSCASHQPNPGPALDPKGGLSYFESPLMPGKKMFLCVGLNAKLAVSSCAGMYEQANATREAPERLFRCRGCPIGAVHAGVATPDASVLRGSSICSRCHRTDLRLIGGNVCVGCKNREYECLKGRNAKGKAPVKHPPLGKRCVRYVEAGVVKSLVRTTSVSTDELVVELLRDSGARVILGRGCVNVNAKVVKQGVLF